MRGSLRSPRQLERTLTTGRTSRNTLRFPLPCKLRSYSPVVTPEQSHAPPRNSNRDLTSLRQHERLPEFPVLPGEESHKNSFQTRVYLWRIHVDIWQNQYNIVKLKKKNKIKLRRSEKLKKKKKRTPSILAFPSRRPVKELIEV